MTMETMVLDRMVLEVRSGTLAMRDRDDANSQTRKAVETLEALKEVYEQRENQNNALNRTIVDLRVEVGELQKAMASFPDLIQAARDYRSAMIKKTNKTERVRRSVILIQNIAAAERACASWIPF